VDGTGHDFARLPRFVDHRAGARRRWLFAHGIGAVPQPVAPALHVCPQSWDG